MLDYLKVKLIDLAYEAKTIRRLENKRLQKAAYARRMTQLQEKILWHEKEITRLKHAHNGLRGDALDLQGRIAAHELSVKILKRQHNNTTMTPANVEYNSKVYWGLRQHRIDNVRKEARITALAYGFLKGKAFKQIEGTSYSHPNWNRIETLVMRYGEDYDVEARRERFRKWKEDALQGGKDLYIPSIIPGSVRGQDARKIP